jgi:large subunit ribosomal protein L18
MNRSIKKIKYRRKREGKTNYKKRLTLLLSKKPRLVIRRSTNNISLQVIDYHEDGDKVLVSANSSELKSIGWKANTGNIPAAYLTGLLLAKKAKNKKVKEVVVDIGLNTPSKGSRIFSALKGAIDGGLETPHTEDRFPSEDVVSGKEIINYLKNTKLIGKQFSSYIKDKIDIAKQFEDVKKKIN